MPNRKFQSGRTPLNSLLASIVVQETSSYFFFILYLLVFRREKLNIPRLVINSHKSFIRVVEIPLTKQAALEGDSDFVLLEATSAKARYSTLKLQELNAKLKSLQEEHEQVQKALSEDLCNQVWEDFNFLVEVFRKGVDNVGDRNKHDFWWVEMHFAGCNMGI